MIQSSVFGNIGTDPELKTTQDGKEFLKFSVASNDGRGDKETTTWVRVTVWGGAAKPLAGLLRKGARVLACGSMRQREWTGDRGKNVDLELDAREVKVIDYPERDQQQAAPQRQAPPAAAPAARPVSPDGMYEYDGRAWVPRQQAAPPPPPAPAPPPPPANGYGPPPAPPAAAPVRPAPF